MGSERGVRLPWKTEFKTVHLKVIRLLQLLPLLLFVALLAILRGCGGFLDHLGVWSGHRLCVRSMCRHVVVRSTALRTMKQ